MRAEQLEVILVVVSIRWLISGLRGGLTLRYLIFNATTSLACQAQVSAS